MEFSTADRNCFSWFGIRSHSVVLSLIQNPFGRVPFVRVETFGSVTVNSPQTQAVLTPNPQGLNPQAVLKLETPGALLEKEMQNEEGDLQQQILAQGCRSNDPEARTSGLFVFQVWGCKKGYCKARGARRVLQRTRRGTKSFGFMVFVPFCMYA